MLLQLLEILKYILPALVVLIATILITAKFLKRESEKQRLEIYEQNSKSTIQMRLQAYERLTIFLERMHPTSMISRFYTQGSTAQDLQLTMVQNIRSEFEHNLSQQVYISHQLWQTIIVTKEQIISMINQVGSGLPMGAPSTHFIKDLTEFVLISETELPSADALKALNKEAKELLLAP